jgi:hypothetical protein
VQQQQQQQQQPEVTVKIIKRLTLTPAYMYRTEKFSVAGRNSGAGSLQAQQQQQQQQPAVTVQIMKKSMPAHLVASSRSEK